MPDENQQKPAGNSLILYKSGELDLSTQVMRMEVPIHRIHPETRVVSGEQMYVGGFCWMQFDEHGVDGCAYLSFYEAAEQKDPSELSLLERMTRRIFGDGNGHVIEHEGRKYRKRWGVDTSRDFMPCTCLVHYDRFDHKMEPTDFPAKLKTRVANERHVVVSNQLLFEVFGPLVEAVGGVYMQVGRF